ncbi:hypothetical protein BJV82DRAFT_668391 [Fennellomyces sp. T-0311]|nr:hypothetical protein BJV82DRAFT_668391 [Fennellomyces sp. T-0311]
MLWTTTSQQRQQDSGSMSYQPDIRTLSSSSCTMNELVTPPVEQEQEQERKGAQPSPPQQQKRKVRSRKYMDDDEKRKNFLERNRQGHILPLAIISTLPYLQHYTAALKCRQRKKQWLNDLQAKADYLTADNEQLQMHVCALRDEVINLRSLLYAHRDCAMIKQMPPSPAPQPPPSDYYSSFNGMIPMVENKIPPDVLPGQQATTAAATGMMRPW